MYVLKIQSSKIVSFFYKILKNNTPMINFVNLTYFEKLSISFPAHFIHLLIKTQMSPKNNAKQSKLKGDKVD